MDKCELVRNVTKMKFTSEKGILNTTKVCFKDKVTRKEREAIDKCLRKVKKTTAWSGLKCVLIR